MNFVSWAFAALFLVVFLARLTVGRRKIEPAAYVAAYLGDHGGGRKATSCCIARA